jgi:hypothetical protein
MLPLLVVGGVIGAVVSAIQGGSWLSDHLGAAGSAATAGGKGEVTPQTQARLSSFEAALAAQAAGQTLPTGTATAAPASGPTTSAAIVSQTHGLDYDALARMKAGIMAYSHVGQHHGDHTGSAKPPGSADDEPVTRS